MIRVLGRVQIDNGVRIVTGIDLCKYYRWLINKQFPHIKTSLPFYGAHVTICNPEIHRVTDFSEVKYLENKLALIDLSPIIHRSSKNFWMPVVKCDFYHEIKWVLGFNERSDWWGLHLTVCNMK